MRPDTQLGAMNMRSNRTRILAGVGLAGSVVGLLGCATEPEELDAESKRQMAEVLDPAVDEADLATVLRSAVPGRVRLTSGKVVSHLQEAIYDTNEGPVREPFMGPTPGWDKLDRNELAEALRAVVQMQGHLWIEEELDYAGADSFIADRSRKGDQTPPKLGNATGPLEEELSGKMVFGADVART